MDGIVSPAYHRDAPHSSVGAAAAAFALLLALACCLALTHDQEDHDLPDPPTWPGAVAIVLAATLLPTVVRQRLRVGVSLTKRGICEHYPLGWRRRLRWADVQAVVVAVDGAAVCGPRRSFQLSPPLEDWLLLARRIAELAPNCGATLVREPVPPELAGRWLGFAETLRGGQPAVLVLAGDLLRWALLSLALLAWPITAPFLMVPVALVLHGSRWQRPALAVCAAVAAAFWLRFGGGTPHDCAWASTGTGLMPLAYAVRLLLDYRPEALATIRATPAGIVLTRGGGVAWRRQVIDWSSIWSLSDQRRCVLITTSDGDFELPRRGRQWQALRSACLQAAMHNRQRTLDRDAVSRVVFGSEQAA